MPLLDIQVPEMLLTEWSLYAEASGLSIESMIQEAVTHSVRNDRLGVEQARLKRLVNETREAELLARKDRAGGAPSNKSDQTSKAPASQEAVPRQPKPVRVIKAAENHALPDTDLDDAHVPRDFFDETGNMAAMDTHIPRDL